MSDEALLSELMLFLIDITVGLSDGFRRLLGTTGVSNRDVLLLLMLQSSPGLSPSELARRLGCSRSMLSQLLRRHIDRGWVRRVIDSNDHRSARLRLTRAGSRAVADLEGAFTLWLDERADGIAAILGADPHADRTNASPLGSLQALSQAGAVIADELVTAAAAGGVEDPTQRLALSILYGHGGLRPAQLGQALGLTSSGVSTLLRRLEVAGLATSSRHRLADKRAVWVELTPRGATLARDWLAIVDRHQAALRQALASIFGMESSAIA